MDKSEHIGFRINEVSHLIHKAIDKSRVDSGMDPFVIKQSWIIGYLTHNEDQVICQKDLETLFHMPKSSATDTLNALEKAGLLERVAIENDARRKRIVLTEKGKEYCKETETEIDAVESYIKKDISQEDMETFIRVLTQLKENAVSYKNI